MDLLSSAKIPAGASLSKVQQCMDRLADSAAPLARSGWKRLLLIQGICVLGPLFWLARRAWGIPPLLVALVTLGTGLLLMGALWWMRWRGMQRTWARARLVAEVARSEIAAAVVPIRLEREVLAAIPELQPLLNAPQAALKMPWPEWKEHWVADRLNGQLAYYKGAREKAEKLRHRNTRWTTLCMDIMLALGAAGLVLTVSDRSPQWLRLFGDYRVESLLGVAGVLLPLGIILLQSLRNLQELNRRTAQFTRQIVLLEKAWKKLKTIENQEAAIRVIQTTEDQLLGEVVDWYFEAETAEQFFQIRDRAQPGSHGRDIPTTAASRWFRPVYLVWAVSGAGLLFLLRVVLGRMPWVLGASAMTLGWLSYSIPSDAESRSRLRAEGTLVDQTGAPWNPDPQRAANGCIIIAHGLHDGAFLTKTGTESLWMRAMSQALENRLSSQAPNIGLVNWADAAVPSQLHQLDPKFKQGQFLGDLAGIRSQAREMGDLLAFRLMQWIVEEKIQRTRPLHLIGHSAGGFVVARAAIRLRQMNLAPPLMQVTLLDTPAPDDEVMVGLPKEGPADFYMTSDFVLLDDAKPPAGMLLKRIFPPQKLGLLEAHSYATAWFIETIARSKPGENGFGQSPFLKPRQP